VAALGSVLFGAAMMFLTRRNQAVISEPLPKTPKDLPATA